MTLTRKQLEAIFAKRRSDRLDPAPLTGSGHPPFDDRTDFITLKNGRRVPLTRNNVKMLSGIALDSEKREEKRIILNEKLAGQRRQSNAI